MSTQAASTAGDSFFRDQLLARRQRLESALIQPAGIVSGDYCDVVPGGDQFLFVLGDASGKGVPASILMAHLHAMFRSLNMMELPLDQLLRRANRMFCESTLPNFYATVVCGRASRSGSIEMANAGHCPPLVARSGKLETAEPTGLPLGLFCDAQYGVHKFDLGGGDRLLLYTDGLSEARNSADEEYGAERVSRLLKQNAVGAAHELAAACAREVRSFLDSRPAHDDLTVLAMRRE